MAKTITSVQHPLVKHLVRLRQNHDYREEHHSVLVEGSKLIGEVCPYHPTKMVISYSLESIPIGVKADEIVLVNESVMRKISGVMSPEGIIAEVTKPASASLKDKKRILACDGVSDPGNMGTLMRTALGLGWDGFFILESSCDPFNDKALRASKGATFRIPIAFGSWNDLEQLAKENLLTCLVADMEGKPLDTCEKAKNILLVLSNEARGASAEALKLCQPITIPMPGAMESLNVAVAGGIMMYHLRHGGEGKR
ncbi:MAG: RNA methyltransferase [Parachlamydiaceae bacterium]|nr:RNA methyltransferase [Parachlamydiaceae bacterium]